MNDEKEKKKKKRSFYANSTLIRLLGTFTILLATEREWMESESYGPREKGTAEKKII